MTLSNLSSLGSHQTLSPATLKKSWTTVITKSSISVKARPKNSQSSLMRPLLRWRRRLRLNGMLWINNESVIEEEEEERETTWSRRGLRTSTWSAHLLVHFRCPCLFALFSCFYALSTLIWSLQNAPKCAFLLCFWQLCDSGHDRLLVWKVSHTAGCWGDLRDLRNCRFGGQVQGVLLLYVQCSVFTKSSFWDHFPKVVGLEDEYRTAMFLYFRYDHRNQSMIKQWWGRWFTI